jgi:hypothetical protein
VDVVGEGGRFLLGLMIKTPHSLHTHRRSSLYIYNAIHHLLQWLVVISMYLQPDICSMKPERECEWMLLGKEVGFCCSYD